MLETRVTASHAPCLSKAVPVRVGWNSQFYRPEVSVED